MISKKMFLDTSETLERIGKSLPQGHPLLEAAALFSPDGSEYGTACDRAADFLRTPEVWSGEIGVAFSAEGRDRMHGRVALLWLGRSSRARDSGAGTSAFQFCLDLASARYKVEYWKAGSGLLAGVETGLGPWLVLSPPEDSSLVVSVEVLAKIDKKDGAV